MNCIKCGNEMNLIGVFDTGSSGLSPVDTQDYAHNVYACDSLTIDDSGQSLCGMAAHERVWNAKGVTWIAPDGTVSVEAAGDKS